MRKLFVVFALFAASVANADSLYLTEFQFNPYVTYQAAVTPAVANQKITISGVSAQSAAFNAATSIVRVHCDVVCSVVVGGTSPTATTSSMRLAAGQTEYFMVRAGDKLAVISNT